MDYRLEEHVPVESLPCAAAHVDHKGLVLEANAAFEQLWISSGGRQPSAVGVEVFIVFAEKDREAIRLTFATHPPLHQSIRVTTVVGCPAPVVVELVPLPSDRTTPAAWLIMLRPVGLDSYPPAQDALAAGLFHDLRAPLQVVLGWTSLLKRKHDDGERLEHALTIIERNARAQLDLLEDLLEVSHPPWARPAMRRMAVDLVELVTAVIRGLEPVRDERGVQLSLAVESRPVVVHGDAVDFRRIVTNLVTNALKFTSRGGIVECHVSCDHGSARLVIADTGRGIRQDLLPRVFEPFIQEQGSPPHEGVGLGLSVVKQLVERHGGRVVAESSGLGHGATFTVVLPALPVPLGG